MSTYSTHSSRYTHVGTWKTHTSRFIRTMETPDILIADKWIRYSYKANMEANKKKVERTFRMIYGRSVAFKEQHTGTIICRFKELQENTGKSIEDIIFGIRRYLGSNINFHTTDGKLIKSDKIELAWNAVQKKEPISKIKEILYV